MRVKTNMNAHLFQEEFEYNSGKSETVPDMSMTVKEMQRRAGLNMPVSVSVRSRDYFEDSDVPDLGRMDLIDRSEYMDKVAREYEEEQRKKAARRAEYDKRMQQRQADEAEIREYIKQRRAAAGGAGGDQSTNVS